MSRALPGLRSNLALDADHTSVIDAGDHRVLVTASCPDYWEGNCLLLDAPPASPDDGADVWTAALARWRAAIDAGPVGAVPHPLIRWESTDPGPIATSVLPAGTTHAQDTVLALDDSASVSGAAPAVECRPAASDADWDAIVAMVLGDEPEDDAHARYRRWAYAALRRRFARTGSTWWTAWDGPLLVGSLGLFRDDALWRFQELETRASHRGRGIASRLIGRALAEPPAGARPPVYMVAETGGAPERLYRRLGFAPVSWIHGIAWEGPP